MAATKRNAMLIEEAREKIKTTQLINRLQDHGLGKVEMSPTQVQAINILLKKRIPDLSSMAMGQDPELDAIKLETIERPPISREAWLAIHNAGKK